MIARVAALVLAAAMVAGALAYRNRQEGGTATGGGGDGPAKGEVVCASELGPVCDAVPGATVEPVSTTADRLLAARSAGEAGVAAWITPGPWPQMVDETRSQQSKKRLFGTPQPLAHTDLVAFVRADRLGACAGNVTWKCLGDAAQAPGFLLGADAAQTPSGLFLRAALLTGFFGNATFASNDFQDARGWLDSVERQIEAGASRNARDVTRFIVAAPEVAAFLTTAAATPQPVPSGFAVTVPSPRVSVTATVATAVGAKPDIARDRVVERLVEGRWRAGPARGGDGLPSPGVLLALRKEIG